MENLMKMYIDGEWVASISGETRKIINPANGDIIGICTEGDERDVKKAVKAAKRAFY